ncbi:MAG: DNA-directed RNA polymerase [Candidatus Nanohalarchaeota archaeon]|nr:MAG: DNA-directed RNA polymerase [Candidatus Nanohaloarchaeota archaeon]
MFEIIKFNEHIGVNQKYLLLSKEERITKTLQETYENRIVTDMGVILTINHINHIEGGNIIIDDPRVHYNVEFDALVFVPKLYEIVDGVVVDIVDFGVFIRFGPIDALCHISQVIDGYLDSDKSEKIITVKNTQKKLKIGDVVRCRIIALSINKKEINKIIVTMRQKGLGSIDWIEQDKKEKAKKGKTAKK